MTQLTDHIPDVRKKLTAVEWLQQKLNDVKPSQFCSIETIKEWAEQAKQMEKEQIIEAYTIGSYDMAEKEFRPEQYYKETYNK